MGDQYRVLVGINYPPDDKRAEVGDVVGDLPDFATSKLLAAGVIEKITDDAKTPDAPVDVPAAPESNPAPAQAEPAAEAPAAPVEAPAEAPAAEPAPEAPAEPVAPVEPATPVADEAPQAQAPAVSE